MNEIETAFKTLIDSIESIKEFDDEELTDDVTEQVLAEYAKNLSGSAVPASIQQIISNLEAQGTSRDDALEAIKQLKEFIKEQVYGEEVITGNKRKIIDYIINSLFNIFDKVGERYHVYAIELPVKLDEGAFIPTYAHDSDAAADLYALEDTTLSAHSFGNKVKTGVSIGLPEGWMAMIFPRSSIGAKTPLRLSNSTGIIDSKQGAIQWAA